MDILIKSFNRVYYLNRCLFSISKYLKNFSGKIYVLDDGTPNVYLEKIQSKYPEIIILKSNNYQEKAKLLEAHNNQLPPIIPSKLWHDSALNISEYFIVLEDDVWFTETINVSELQQICEKEHIALVVDEYGSVSGLVSQEDVIETLLGLEIMDESDSVADLQAHARKSWKNRAKRMGNITDKKEE